MDFRLTDEQLTRRKEFIDVCKELEKKKPTEYISWESAFNEGPCWVFHLHCAKEFAKRGWLTLNWPDEYGGRGTMMDRVLFAEARGYYGIPGVNIWGVHMLAPTLLACASEEMKRRFLPPIASAEIHWCQLWSEPNAGSDLAMLTTTAIKKDNEYIINGQKIWITAASRADWGFGVFKTDSAGQKHHNLTFLLLDMKTPGITVRPIPYMSGEVIYSEVFFDDVKVPIENVVGQEGEGWAVVNTLAAFERSGLDEIMTRVRELEDLVRYCNETKRNGGPLSQNPIVRHKLAQMACELEAARVLSYRIADMQNRNELPLMEAAGLKIFSSELSERFAFLATDILGLFGQVKRSQWAPLNGSWESMYQHNFVFTISAGSNEIQRNIIAWYGLGLPRMK